MWDDIVVRTICQVTNVGCTLEVGQDSASGKTVTRDGDNVRNSINARRLYGERCRCRLNSNVTSVGIFNSKTLSGRGDRSNIKRTQSGDLFNVDLTASGQLNQSRRNSVRRERLVQVRSKFVGDVVLNSSLCRQQGVRCESTTQFIVVRETSNGDRTTNDLNRRQFGDTNSTNEADTTSSVEDSNEVTNLEVTEFVSTRGVDLTVCFLNSFVSGNTNTTVLRQCHVGITSTNIFPRVGGGVTDRWSVESNSYIVQEVEVTVLERYICIIRLSDKVKTQTIVCSNVGSDLCTDRTRQFFNTKDEILFGWISVSKSVKLNDVIFNGEVGKSCTTNLNNLTTSLSTVVISLVDNLSNSTDVKLVSIFSKSSCLQGASTEVRSRVGQ